MVTGFVCQGFLRIFLRGLSQRCVFGLSFPRRGLYRITWAFCSSIKGLGLNKGPGTGCVGCGAVVGG